MENTLYLSTGCKSLESLHMAYIGGKGKENLLSLAEMLGVNRVEVKLGI